MNDIIQLLPDSVANQIAAGEVIQRPASVVKELMENAIDAGATSLQVILKDAGRTLIQVIDNGKGMSMTDARMAFERHATSKIRKADDLFSLQTMGFRGEALASVAAIAQVELRTRREEDEIGTALFISGSEVERQEAVSCPVGSSFQVKNIFFNVPARRKFLKSNQTELSNIISEFERIALVNPNISFSLFHNENEVLNLPATNLRQRIINIFGKSLNQQLLTVEVDTTMISVSGYIGRPEAARKKNALQYFFVNGRYMRHPYFHKAVMQSYEQLIPSGEMPNYFLYFNVDPANIDVNIHPTKTEIKFENETFLWQIISATVKEALGKFSAVPSIDFDMADAPEIPVFKTETVQPPQPQFNSSYNPFQQNKGTIQQPSTNRRPDPDWQKLYGGDSAQAFSSGSSTSGFTESLADFPESLPGADVEFEGDPDYFHTDAVFPSSAEDDNSFAGVAPTSFESQITSDPVSSSMSSSMSLVFGNAKNADGEHYQFKGKYILTSVKSGLMMIDQHRAHLRVLFDQYMENITNKQGISQGVLFPEMITFAPADVPVLEGILDDLHFLGFDLNNMGGCTYAINGIPAGIEGLDVSNLLHSMVDTAREKGRDIKTDIHELIALSLAEVAAIPYGQLLNMDEMEKLIDDLFASSSPNYTPDGKLILSVISNDEVAKRFK
ncbi:MAG: DNA mismatch repair endonuclease MutL [Bacteroidales bacterium]